MTGIISKVRASVADAIVAGEKPTHWKIGYEFLAAWENAALRVQKIAWHPPVSNADSFMGIPRSSFESTIGGFPAIQTTDVKPFEAFLLDGNDNILAILRSDIDA